MIDNSQLLNTAASQLYDLIYASLKSPRGVHLETAITAAGYLAGFELQRASGVNLSALAPGSAVFNLPGVDDSGPDVINYIVEACHRAGIADRPPPDLAIPPAHKPLESYLPLMTRLAAPYLKLTSTLPPDFNLRWIAPAQTCVKLIVAGKSVLSPSIGQALAIEAVVTGAKTVPPLVSGTATVRERS